MTTTLTTTQAAALDTQELAALPPSKAEQIRATFVPMADMLQSFEDAYNEVMTEAAEEVTPEVSKRARRLRLDIAKIRIDAEKARKGLKEEYLLAGRAIDGTNNILKWAISEKETALEAIEKHAERIEEERLAALHAERCDLLLPYVDEIPDLNFGVMEADVWDAYLSAKRQAHEDRLEAERQAEAERVERERVAALVRERERKIAPVFDFFEAVDDLGALPDEDFAARLETAGAAKAEHEAEQERIRAENERLAREAAEKEAARQAELAKIEAERKAERVRLEAERAKEREAAKKERVRLAELEQAEKERREREEAEAKARAAAEAKAAKAPVRKRLTAWVDTFALPELPGGEHEKVAEIRQRFAAFREWAKSEVEAI